MNEKNIRENIKKFFKENPNTELSASQVADKFNFFPKNMNRRSQMVRDMKRTALGRGSIVSALGKAYTSFKEELSSYKENFEKGTIESTITISFDPKSVEELYTEHKIDSAKYTIKNYWSKKTPAGKFTSSVFATKKTSDNASGEDYLKLLENYISNYTPLTKKDILINTSFIRPTSVLLDITDFHLDKMDIHGTTLSTKVAEYHEVLNRLLYKCYQANYIDEIVFVLGSDMLHTDSYQGTTTNLTPQDVNVSWDKAFTTCFDIYVESINKLKQFCNKLKVILIAGNHGFTKEFYLAYGLKKFFESESNIEFQVDSSPRKIHVYGNTFIGFHHGNTKIQELPLSFAKEYTIEWGQAKYHEVIVGDKHYHEETEIQGVRIKRLPCTSPADRWHNMQGYINAVKATIAVIYDKEFGRCMTVEERFHV